MISLDMEGVSGIVSRQEILPVGPYYRDARRWYTWDANAAIEGLIAAGATEILLLDPHHQLNILWPELHPKAQIVRRDLLSGYIMNFLQGLDQTFDLLIFVGQHTRHAHPTGILNHTFCRSITHMRINGQYVNEAKMCTALAGQMGVPVGLVTGDDVFCDEMKVWLPQVETAVTKYALDMYSALCLPKEQSHDRIRQAAQRAAQNIPELKPFSFATPTELEIDVVNPAVAAKVTFLPGVERTGDLTVRYVSDSFDNVWRIMSAIILIALFTKDPVPAHPVPW